MATQEVAFAKYAYESLSPLFISFPLQKSSHKEVLKWSVNVKCVSSLYFLTLHLGNLSTWPKLPSITATRRHIWWVRLIGVLQTRVLCKRMRGWACPLWIRTTTATEVSPDRTSASDWSVTTPVWCTLMEIIFKNIMTLVSISAGSISLGESQMWHSSLLAEHQPAISSWGIANGTFHPST